MKAKIIHETTIDDYTAQKAVDWARKFYAVPENMEEYREWHLKKYHCLPEECHGGKRA